MDRADLLLEPVEEHNELLEVDALVVVVVKPLEALFHLDTYTCHSFLVHDEGQGSHVLSCR